MVIYRVKIKIQTEKEQEWFNWMATTHIKDVINTGHFLDYTFYQLLQNGKPDPGFSVYEIQYACKNLEELQAYENNEAIALRDDHAKRYGQYIKSTERSILKDRTELELLDYAMSA